MSALPPPKADMDRWLRNVRYQKRALDPYSLYHFVRASEQCRRHSESECVSGLQIDDKLNLRRLLLDRQSRLGSGDIFSENTVSGDRKPAANHPAVHFAVCAVHAADGNVILPSLKPIPYKRTFNALLRRHTDLQPPECAAARGGERPGAGRARF